MKIKDKYYRKTEYLLYNYKMLEISITNMEDDIQLLKKEEGLSAIDYDTTKISPTYKFTSITEDAALATIEKIDYLKHSIRRIKGKIESIDRALEGLTEEERVILTEKYIEGKQWWQVAYKVSYSERHCRNLRTDAIKKMALGIFGDISVLLPHEEG